MSATLDPVTLNRMARFDGRRRRMLALRALYAAIVILVLSIAVVATVDYLVVLSDQVRWALSLSAYLLAGVTAWAMGFGKLLFRPSREKLAQMIETADPELRERLLAAVELETGDANVDDSIEFRQLLQQDVAGLMDRMQLGKILPARLLFRWFAAAFVLVAVCVGLFRVSGSPFPRLPNSRLPARCQRGPCVGNKDQNHRAGTCDDDGRCWRTDLGDCRSIGSLDKSRHDGNQAG